MRKIAAGLFVSLDGVVESPEKWTGPYFNDQVGQAVGAMMAANDAMLLGRTTYEGFAAAFGGQSGGMADQMNNTPKFVVSTTLTSAGWQNSTLISGAGDDVAEQIRELKQQPGRDIGMSGGSTLVSWLLRHGLLDRLDLLVFPVVIGTGKRLFSEPDGQVPLTLTGSESFSTGVVHLSYDQPRDHRLDQGSGTRRPRPVGARAFLGRPARRHAGEWYPGWVTLEPPPHGQRLSFQATTMPLAEHTARVHFDILVEDLAAAHARVIAAGATLTAEHVSRHPGPDGEPVPWRVYRNPVGHPFCLVIR